MFFPLLVVGAALLALGKRSDEGARDVAGVRGCDGGSCTAGGCARCGTIGPARPDVVAAFAGYLVEQAMLGDAGAHELVAYLERAAAMRNAHALRLVGAMHAAFAARHPLTDEYLVKHLRSLGPVGLA